MKKITNKEIEGFAAKIALSMIDAASDNVPYIEEFLTEEVFNAIFAEQDLELENRLFSKIDMVLAKYYLPNGYKIVKRGAK